MPVCQNIVVPRFSRSAFLREGHGINPVRELNSYPVPRFPAFRTSGSSPAALPLLPFFM
jgi:hypothetical protein